MALGERVSGLCQRHLSPVPLRSSGSPRSIADVQHRCIQQLLGLRGVECVVLLVAGTALWGQTAVNRVLIPDPRVAVSRFATGFFSCTGAGPLFLQP